MSERPGRNQGRTRDTLARLIRSAPDTHTVEGSEELADRILQVTRSLPATLAPKPQLRPVRSDTVEVRTAANRIRQVERLHRIGDDEPSRRRRILEALLEIVEDYGIPIVRRAIEELVESRRGER
jgi:hypothetical protein